MTTAVVFAYHNVGANPEERKAIANKIFEIEKRALQAAIAGAPEILFIAGSGNENNSEWINSNFLRLFPNRGASRLRMPRLIRARESRA